jgi:hypothetical protein
MFVLTLLLFNFHIIINILTIRIDSKFAPSSNLTTLDALQLSSASIAHKTSPIDCFVTRAKSRI